MNAKQTRTLVNATDAQLLVDLFTALIEFLKDSVDSAYSNESIASCQKSCELELENLNQWQKIDLEGMGYLFAPSGDLQEFSITNNWTGAYLTLSKTFDVIHKKYSTFS
jgi:hypothetical protein